MSVPQKNMYQKTVGAGVGAGVDAYGGMTKLVKKVPIAGAIGGAVLDGVGGIVGATTNAFEGITGLDLDGDGDVGKTGRPAQVPQPVPVAAARAVDTRRSSADNGAKGYPQQYYAPPRSYPLPYPAPTMPVPAGIPMSYGGYGGYPQAGYGGYGKPEKKSMLNKLESATGLDIDGDGDKGVQGSYKDGYKGSYGGYPQGGYGGYPQAGYGGYPQAGYGGYPGAGYGAGYPSMYQSMPMGYGAAPTMGYGAPTYPAMYGSMSMPMGGYPGIY
eukprot:CAMPEP_0206224078 /NCGR_PEP_ID=MMETSP0047_2-20121206/6836_1 /ASSEMBLY_ACC=CAM_ASM_000192 /TAXON_ID=195065 /ORGANISM="Chroomonas mesostigmatica_cf, Strain CCMP1168" /LENGTH=270 /DNA_ID=CAMNT_0053647015 /DNA_START=34 /DNA_END=846 /DNA_ORIENTATION=-